MRFAQMSPCAAFAILTCLALSGCTEQATVLQRGPVYPDQAVRTAVLDIQAIQNERTLTITNTSARNFGPARLWINRWYALEVDGFAVGQRLELRLGSFIDRHGDGFRGGGFLAPEKPDKVVQVQIEPMNGTERQFYSCVVVIAPDERLRQMQ